MRRKLFAILLTLMLLAATACAEITSIEQLNAPDIRIGVDQGSASEITAREALPKATFAVYNDKPTGYLAVAQGKLDAFIYDQNQLMYALANGVKGVRLLDDTLGEPVKIAIGISPKSAIPDLQGKINQFIAELREAGTLDDMFTRWVKEGNDVIPDIPQPENPTLTLTVATSGIVPPFSYYVGTQLNGYDIEMAHRLAAWLDAKLEFKVYDYGAIVPAALTGDADCIIANLNMTPERAESLPFSDILYESSVGAIVADGASQSPQGAYTSLAQLDGKRIGVQTGSSFDGMVQEKMPGGKVLYFNSKADLVAALTGNKIDAFVVDEPVARLLMREEPRITYLPEYLDEYTFAFVFPEGEAGEALRDQFNAFLDGLKSDGTLDALAEKWFSQDENEEAKTMPDIKALPAENGKLRLATESGYAPFEYVRDDAVVGYDMEIAALFCEANGYGLEIVDMNFDGILPSIQAGKCDFAAAGISVTPERAENVLFSEPNYSGGTVAMVLKDKAQATGQTAANVHWRDYNGKRLGVLVGPLMEDAAKEYFPDSETVLYDSYPDCITALLTGKIDAYLADEPEMKSVHAERADIDYIHDRITQNNYSFAFRKNDPQSKALCEELNAFLAQSREDGTIQELEDIWFGVDEDRKVVDMSDLTGENGTIRVVTTSTDMPYSYIKDGKNVGYDIDLVTRFCRDRGYGLELGDVDFAGRIPAIESGKYDFTTDMNVTPEREEQVLFSNPTSYGGIVLAVLSQDLVPAEAEAQTPSRKPFLESIGESFNKTFIRENRWKLFVEGVLTTLEITLLTILFGTLLGFVVFMLCRNGNPVANAVTRFCLWLVQGMPMVVLLMILYYVVFGKTTLSGIVVAVIGFTFTFGAGVFGLLKIGVGAVDGGQYEAAYALGYSNRQTFYKIIFPQALPHVLPAYRGEIVSLIKATAIVGYIAVQDLTKMGDIVRSRTYEAFFPLIAVTVIYFILEGLLGTLVGRITVNLNPKHRKPKDILKGVKTDD